ncbi:MAG: hypothetical protein P4L51_12920 [Puia sp.]|nr:hypothetical protein [Puia sp.]
MHFDKIGTTGSASSHMERRLASRNTRIAYLNRNNFTYYKVPGSHAGVDATPEAAVPDWNFLLSALLLFLGLSYTAIRQTGLNAVTNREGQAGPPRLYLQMLRLRI